MNRSELIARMTGRLGGDRASAVAAVTGVLEEIEAGVARGERVTLSGFGTFEPRARAARTARNPRTGASVQVDATIVPVFRAATGFKTLLHPDGAQEGTATTLEVVASPPTDTGLPAADGGRKKQRKAAKQATQEGGKAAKSDKKASKKARKAAKSKAGKKTA